MARGVHDSVVEPMDGTDQADPTRRGSAPARRSEGRSSGMKAGACKYRTMRVIARGQPLSAVLVGRGRHSGIHKTRKQNGQAMVELASLLPLLSIILLGCLDLGRAFHVHMAAANAAHVGLMYAQQVTDPTDPTTSKGITVADVITKTVNS